MGSRGPDPKPIEVTRKTLVDSIWLWIRPWVRQKTEMKLLTM